MLSRFICCRALFCSRLSINFPWLVLSHKLTISPCNHTTKAVKHLWRETMIHAENQNSHTVFILVFKETFPNLFDNTSESLSQGPNGQTCLHTFCTPLRAFPLHVVWAASCEASLARFLLWFYCSQIRHMWLTANPFGQWVEPSVQSKGLVEGHML